MTKKKTVKAIAIVLAFVSLMTFSACSSTDDYSANIYVLDEDEQALVLNPSIEYVVTALNQVETIVSGYGTGERTPSTENLLALSYLYSCSTDYLLGKQASEPQYILDVEGLTNEQIHAISNLIDTIREK